MSEQKQKLPEAHDLEAINTDTQPTDAVDLTMTTDEFVAWATEHGYGEGKRGTYRNAESYLYIKACHQVAAEDREAALQVTRELTKKGILHPDTQWGMYPTPHDETVYQLFAVSPRLEVFDLDEHFDKSVGAELSKPITDESSPLIEWVRRIEPGFISGQELADDSLVHLLNTYEASHPENWGWDENRILYPVDVEVINLRRADIFKKWASEHSPVEAVH